ncbi:uncharacterized LOC100382341 [Zea mays]|uniref:non-specific serine/threonine protein kinase n=1 Tax=Zea mays TaxID=4577 RepID=C0P6Q2_MAIZE|nr:uncharacterized LOC100382341 [Zea mays]ACN28668.1 unknown [Zea mays]|eukprot:NP_001168559.1 uncharacterized protein LOC100382341 [Zea mays]
MANLFVKAKFILANKRCACYFWLYKTLTVDCDIAFYLFSVNSSEMRSISDRIAASPLRVPASPSRFSLSSPPSYFGKVYRAALLDGRVVAIKRAKKENFLSLRAEFSNEVALLKSIEHKNLVQLLGYIDKANERILITEYISNGTLREHLDGQHGLVLGFNQRLEIAIDVAHGLTYLHLYAEKPIIHRDVKSSNILLTEAFMAKVADFGFARTGPTEPDQSQIETDVRGTAGYLDPEYMGTSHLTIKSDVFSYGILLLEILSGRRPIERTRGPAERITVRWAFNKYRRGNVRGILDPMLTEAVNEDILNKIFDVAFQCVAPTREDRPSMKEVVERLWKIRRDHTKIQRIAELTL